MVETIAPVVYGNRKRYFLAVAIHALSAGAGGALFGAGLGLAGLLTGAPWGAAGLYLVTAVAISYALRELARVPIPIFDRKQQVPDWWRTFYSPMVAAALYGAGLGIGFLTFLRHGTYIAACAVAFASGDPAAGLVIGGSFGFVRGASAVVNARSGDEQAAALTVQRLETIATTTNPQMVNGLMCVAVAIAALVSLA